MDSFIDDPEVFDLIYKRNPKSLSVNVMMPIILLACVINILFAACRMWTIGDNTRPFCEAIYLA